MAEQDRQPLLDAFKLIKANRRHDATRILVDFLKQHRDSAEAWWLLANAADAPAKKRQALEQVLRVQPDHAAARRQLSELGVTGLDRSGALPGIRPLSPPTQRPPQPDPPPQKPFIVEDFDSFLPGINTTDTDAGITSEPVNDSFTVPVDAYNPVDDPFAGTTSGPERDVFDDEPSFGDLLGTPGAETIVEPVEEQDPFGDPFATDEPYQVRPERLSPVRPVQKRGPNPLVIALAIIGLIVVVGCGLFAMLTVRGVDLFNTVVQTSMPGGTFESVLQNLELVLTDVNANAIYGDIVEKGTINLGQTIRNTLEDDGFTNHSYKFAGTQGQTVAVELTAIDNAFDPRLTVLGPDGDTIAYNDDIDFRNNNLNSRTSATLPENGIYTVIVSDVGFDGGDYELTVR